MSHFERPKARDPKYSLKPIAEKLAEVLGRPVAFAEDCVRPAAEAVIAGLKPGEVAVLENLRFHKGEEQNDPEFARHWRRSATFVGEAFSSAHRARLGRGITRFLPSYAGPLMAQIRRCALHSRSRSGRPPP